MEDGPPRFPPDFTCPVVLGCPLGLAQISYTGLSPSAADHSRSFYYLCQSHIEGPTTPKQQAVSVWAGPRSLAATRGITIVFYSSGYLDVSVPRVGRRTLCIYVRLAGSPCAGYPIRRSLGHSLLAASLSFSQLSTSFIASHRLGIHRTLFVA